MGTKPTTSLRLNPATRQIAEIHGGNLAAGVSELLHRQDRTLRAALPRNLSPVECEALCGALKGWPLWLDDDGKIGSVGEALALEVEDYHRLDSESEQWPDLDWPALAAKCRALDRLEVLAVAYAVEAVFGDRDGNLREIVARHFRLPKPGRE